MATWWQRLKSTKAKATSNNYENEEASLDRYLRRIQEIHIELGEIGKIFEETSSHPYAKLSEEDTLRHLVKSINKLTIPGYCAYKLAEEGLTLVDLITVKVASLHREYEELGIKTESERLRDILNLMENTQQLLLRTLEEMSPYRTLDANKTLELIIERDKKSKNI